VCRGWRYSISKDFTGFELLLPFIEEVKVNDPKASQTEAEIRSNVVLQKVFDYIYSDMKISVDEYFLIIANAFSGVRLRSGLDRSHLSFVQKIYEYCSANWDQIEETVAFLRRFDTNKLCSMVEKYLPKTIVPPHMVIRFVLDGGDCRGFQGEIYADLTLLAILGKAKATGLLAHEFHHSCRAEIAVPYKGTRHAEVFQVLYWLESEGIADKVYDIGQEKPDNMFEPLLKLVKIRRRMYSHASDYLKLFDNALRESQNPMPVFRDNAYHPVGHFMADVIESALGTRELVETVGDPLRFVEAYNESAGMLQKSSIFILSEGAIKRLTKIREKFG
jgi:hypothetical protein